LRIRSTLEGVQGKTMGTQRHVRAAVAPIGALGHEWPSGVGGEEGDGGWGVGGGENTASSGAMIQGRDGSQEGFGGFWGGKNGGGPLPRKLCGARSERFFWPGPVRKLRGPPLF
jgi:hypothetical protein